MNLIISKQTAKALEKCIRFMVINACDPELQKLDPIRMQQLGISNQEIELISMTSKQIKNHLNTKK